MKNSIFLLLVLSVATFGCKKKVSKPAVSMTVIVDGDTAFTTTDVVTSNQGNGVVYISAVNNPTKENISLAVTGFIEGKKAYYIDYRGVGGNINGNTGTYSKNSNLFDAQTGNIYITSVANNTITGSFDLYLSTVRVNGYFTAAEK